MANKKILFSLETMFYVLLAILYVIWQGLIQFHQVFSSSWEPSVCPVMVWTKRLDSAYGKLNGVFPVTEQNCLMELEVNRLAHFSSISLGSSIIFETEQVISTPRHCHVGSIWPVHLHLLTFFFKLRCQERWPINTYRADFFYVDSFSVLNVP